MNTGQGVSQIVRILSMFERLLHGGVVRKGEEAEQFNVGEKTIQRDIDHLRAYLAEQLSTIDFGEIVYSRRHAGYILERGRNSWLNCREVLVLTKVLLESRAFPKEEIDALLDKLLLQCDRSEQKHLQDVLRNERFHYVSVQHKQPIMGKIWELSQAIMERRIVQLTYNKTDIRKGYSPIERAVKPLGVIFSEFYFYLIADIHGKEYEYPAIFRLDRIGEYSITNDHFLVPYADRFQEGEFRKRVQFMHTGKIITVRFRFCGRSVEAVLDRLPTARILSRQENSYLIEAEVFGRGIKMWLLSQGNKVAVISPPDFREEMKATVLEMAKHYEN